MAGFNPCYCWNLKDGCVTVGIWTLVLSIIQMAIFGWQTAIIKFERDKTANRRLPSYWGYSIYDNRMGGGDWTEYYVTPEEKFYTGLFVIQILNLIAAFFLLFASVSLIYGIHTSSKYLVWPWFPCIAAAIVCSLAYCVMWWVGDVTSYWLVLTVVEIISVLINLYCLFCVIVQYRRIVRGYLPASEDDSLKNQRLVGYEYPYRPGETGVLTYPPEKKVGEGVWNVMYEPEGSPASRVRMYAAGKDPYGRQIGPPGELVAYSTEPAGMVQQQQQQGGDQQQAGEEEFPCSKSEMTEEWLKNVMTSHPEEPKIQPVLEHLPSPGKRDRDRERAYYSRSRSVDAALAKEAARADKGRRSVRSSKSKESICSKRSGGRGRRGGDRDSSVCSTCSSSCSSGTEDATTTAVGRSKGRRTRSHHRGDRSDSEDTGYSRSGIDSSAERKRPSAGKHHRQSSTRRRHDDDEDGRRRHRDGDGHRRHRHHHHHHHHRSRHAADKDKDTEENAARSRKRLRDVKREDKERRLHHQQQQQEPPEPTIPAVPPVRPETSSSAASRPMLPPGAVPVFPPTGAGAGAGAHQPGAISIPQHIVIPPQPKGAPNQPQRFHINSEITISYSDRSAPGSDSEHRPPTSSSGPSPTHQQGLPGPSVAPAVPAASVTPVSPVRRPVPPVPPPRGVGGGGGNGNGGSSNTSAESKGYGSTAV